MGKFIIKIKDLYFDWSTVVDAPITYGMTREELEAYHLAEYGRAAHERDFDNRMRRVMEKGTSAMSSTLNQVLICNRAGDNEAELTAEEIYEVYT